MQAQRLPDPRANPHPARWLVSALVAAAIVTGSAAFAQGLEDPQAVDKIIGSDIEEEQVDAAAHPERILAAIDKTSANIATVPMTSTLDRMDIVFLPDSSAAEGGPPPEIEAKVKANRDSIDELRKEIEGNAMIYHAINSRQILPRDVLAVEFEAPARLVIYAAAKPPAN